MQLCGVLKVADNTKLCLVAEEKTRSMVLSCCHASVTALWFSESAFRFLWGLAWAVAKPMTPVFYCFRDFKESVFCFIFLQPVKFMQLSWNVCFLLKNVEKAVTGQYHRPTFLKSPSPFVWIYKLIYASEPFRVHKVENDKAYSKQETNLRK